MRKRGTGVVWTKCEIISWGQSEVQKRLHKQNNANIYSLQFYTLNCHLLQLTHNEQQAHVIGDNKCSVWGVSRFLDDSSPTTAVKLWREEGLMISAGPITFPFDTFTAPLLLSHPAGLRARAPPGTTAPRTGTRSPRTWPWTGRTCSATACPGTWSRGRACRGRSARWRARFARCSAHPWTGHASSSSVSRPLRRCHPARALKRPSVSGSGRPFGGRSYERKEVWPTSSTNKKKKVALLYIVFLNWPMLLLAS